MRGKIRLSILSKGLTSFCTFVLRKNFNLSKNTEIKFVIRPIFKQLISLFDGKRLGGIANNICNEVLFILHFETSNIHFPFFEQKRFSEVLLIYWI